VSEIVLQVSTIVAFISYSHDTDEHKLRVLTLANRLRADGIDVHIDQYEDSPPEGWPRWMEAWIRKAQYVLVLCTETFMIVMIPKRASRRSCKNADHSSRGNSSL
jgi:hypothetical protein